MSDLHAATPPFRLADSGFVVDALGDTVLVCDDETPCERRFSERLIEADPHYICPECGRLGLRMVEATPALCQLPTPNKS